MAEGRILEERCFSSTRFALRTPRRLLEASALCVSHTRTQVVSRSTSGGRRNLLTLSFFNQFYGSLYVFSAALGECN